MATDDFFRARLDQMIDLRHPLAVSTRMPWSDIEAALAPAFAHRDRKGRPSSTLTARKSLIRLDLWSKAQTTKQAQTGRRALVPAVEGQ
jgi:hypothetical protein